MTAIGLSCYGLFTKTIAFAAFLQCVATLLVKSHFFILSLPRSLLKGFCLFGVVACRQGRLLFFQETRPGQNQERLFRGEIVSCVQRNDCALLRAKTSALLRRKTCAVLRARTCALLRANTKEAAFGRPPLWFPLYWL